MPAASGGLRARAVEWLLAGLFAAAGFGATVAGCTNPRACETDSDCFEEKVCRNETCVDLSSKGAGSVDGASSGGGTAPSDGGDGSSASGGETGGGDGGSGDASGGSTDGSGDTGATDETSGDTASRSCDIGPCRAPSVQGTCDENDEVSLELGCVFVDNEETTYQTIGSDGPKASCHCGEDEGDGNTDTPRLDQIEIHRATNWTNCPEEHGNFDVDVTVELGMCFSQDYDELTFRADFDDEACPSERTSTDTRAWCDYHPADGRVVMHWRPRGVSQRNSRLTIQAPPEAFFNWEASAEAGWVE